MAASERTKRQRVLALHKPERFLTMPATSSPPPRPRWLRLLIPALLLGVAVALAAWVVLAGNEPGTRTRIVWPGSASASSGGGRTLTLAPELIADQVTGRLGAMLVSSNQTFFICHEVCKHEIVITAGPRPLPSATLRYALFDADGNQISAGDLHPATELAANQEATFIIGDFALEQARKIVISKR
jgi:hypothetical protein